MKIPSELSQAYYEHLVSQGKRPQSVASFCLTWGLTEADFYEQYGSFSAIEGEFILQYFITTIDQLESDPDYLSYDVGTKLLSVYFTWLAVMGEHRSFIKVVDRLAKPQLLGLPAYLVPVKEEFMDFVRRLLKQGLQSGELSDRWVLSRYYKNLLWTNARFVLDYWLHDQSKSFERSDAAIEKSARFALDLIRPNAFDSGIDLVRFLVQNTKDSTR